MIEAKKHVKKLMMTIMTMIDIEIHTENNEYENNDDYDDDWN